MLHGGMDGSMLRQSDPSQLDLINAEKEQGIRVPRQERLGQKLRRRQDILRSLRRKDRRQRPTRGASLSCPLIIYAPTLTILSALTVLLTPQPLSPSLLMLKDLRVAVQRSVPVPRKNALVAIMHYVCTELTIPF